MPTNSLVRATSGPPASYPKRYLPLLLDRYLYFKIVDLTDPTRAVTSTLDGPVLAVLAQAGRPLTVGEVAAQTARGSEIGVRKSLSRLVGEGIVRATLMGRNRVHELNRAHVAAPVADLLAGLRLELWRRLRETVTAWDPKPVYACVFGSAARGDGGPESDIDLLLVHPRFPGETAPPRSKGTAIIDAAEGLFEILINMPPAVPVDQAAWDRQVDQLHGLVPEWTGNRLQAVDLSVREWYAPPEATRGLLKEVSAANVVLI